MQPGRSCLSSQEALLSLACSSLPVSHLPLQQINAKIACLREGRSGKKWKLDSTSLKRRGTGGILAQMAQTRIKASKTRVGGRKRCSMTHRPVIMSPTCTCPHSLAEHPVSNRRKHREGSTLGQGAWESYLAAWLPQQEFQDRGPDRCHVHHRALPFARVLRPQLRQQSAQAG